MFWRPWFRSFLMQSPCNLHVEDYTEVIYMIHKQDGPPVQCEMNFRRSESERQVDGSSFIFVDFNFPALASRLNWIETALQLSDNITFAICGIHTSVIRKEGQMNTWCLGVSFIYILLNVGVKTEPWGTPACISLSVNILHFTETSFSPG
jgi:hypothetical protein